MYQPALSVVSIEAAGVHSPFPKVLTTTEGTDNKASQSKY